MPNAQSQTIDSFTYDGAMGWPWAVAIFVALGLFVGWLLWRERQVTGPRTALFFFLLRLAAIGLVLWMLLGPTHLATTRTTTPQTLALVVDCSQSMDVAQPMPKVERLRWQRAVGDEAQEFPELFEVDAGLVALRHAASRLRQTGSNAADFGSVAELFATFDVIQNATHHASKHLEQVGRALATADSELSRRAVELADELERDAASGVEKLAASWKNSQPTETADLAASLAEEFERCLRLTESLEQAIVARVSETTDGQTEYGQTWLSRKELSTKVLERLEAGILGEMAKTTHIKRVRVDELASTLPADRPWAETLQAPAVAPAPKSADSAETAEAAVGPVTNLTAALELLRQDAAAESITSAIFFSDGGHNAPGMAEPRSVAAGLTGLPVHVAPVSSQEPLRDLVLHRVNAPMSVALKDKIIIEAVVTGQGISGDQVTVELRSEGELLERRALEFNSDRQDHRLRFTVPADRLGQREFELTAAPVPNEISTTNNSAVLAVRVLRDKTRVLLTDRMSRWEYRYLDQLFRRDQHVEFDKLLFLPTLVATGRLEVSKRLPSDVDGWAAYDVVILGDLEPSMLDEEQQRSLEDWVRTRGGNLIVIAGSEFMPHEFAREPLAGLLPVQEGPRRRAPRDGYLPFLTREGAWHEALLLSETELANTDLWSEQYRAVPIFFLSSFSAAKPAAHVLIEAAFASDGVASSERALLSWQEVGAGRVVYLASPVTYHLRFRRGDELHHKFWGQMLRWLTAAERGKRQNQIFVRTAQSRYQPGEPVEVTVNIANDDGSPLVGLELSAVAKSPTGEPVTVPLTPDQNIPGRYLGKFDGLQSGAYRIAVAGDAIDKLAAAHPDAEEAQTLVNISSSENIEMNNTRGNRALLREVAEITGGQVLFPDAIGEMLELSSMAPRVVEDSVRTPLWNRWRYLWIVVGCLMAEWITRRMVGLV